MYYENVFRSLRKNNIRYGVAGDVSLVLTSHSLFLCLFNVSLVARRG